MSAKMPSMRWRPSSPPVFRKRSLVEKAPLIHKYFHDDVQKKAMRNMILDEGKRLDGRRTDEIRPIWCEVGYLPAAHGSAIFTRGETQSLTTVTLGTKMDDEGQGRSAGTGYRAIRAAL